MAEQVFGCDLHIIEGMPVGCMIVMSGDGKQIIPVVNLDIETCSTLGERVDKPGPVEIEYGQREVSGTMTAYFEDPDLYARFVSPVESLAKLAMEAIVKLGDDLAAKGKLNKHGRKHWRTHRKRMAAYVRREEARERRRAYGLATF